MRSLSAFVIAMLMVAPPVLTWANPARAGWQERAVSHIASHQVMPRSAELRGVSCRTNLTITVDGNGLVTGYDVAPRCASDILARATDDLMLTLPQFPPPPQRRGGTAVLPVRWPPTG